MSGKSDDDVLYTRLRAPHVRTEFTKRAPDQEVIPEREPKAVDGKTPRAPETPKLVLRPPFALAPGGGREGGPAPVSGQEPPRSLAERKQAAKERESGLERKNLAETFTEAKLRSLAERRFNAASKNLDYGQER